MADEKKSGNTNFLNIFKGLEQSDWKTEYLMNVGYPASYEVDKVLNGFKGSYKDYVKEHEAQRKSRTNQSKPKEK